ncbi:NAD-dependent epimerase/dehydratase family protein [Vagococcus carniphilus]|uniref:NAD-dependent dehydratase n=1 Tax=Vagococcus carniphilus TaxID=218144 RepID=A0A430ATE6_9ENTE|nr:NAD-dependent epimerase/dehydratase family protein [Vagococcus carniphilus]QNN73285.1 NAD-dependent epimerase/dehydratase family protein [Vagococcus carniphilus]RSU11332.1 NAD-dependent dehydratase [Vagococcus carniphilus]
MQTILGSNGQIGQEVAKELYKNYTKEIRLVGRNPKKIHDSDQLVTADLLNFEDTKTAIKNSDIVYFTVGLPMNSELWESDFLTIAENVITACKLFQSKLVFFDNTYMYPKNNQRQTETTIFNPVGRKAAVRAKMADLFLSEINNSNLDVVICRAPEFYGPDKTQSITNTMFLNKIKANKKAKIPINQDALRSLIWTPDASRAMALIGNTPSAYNQTWHLPCDNPVTYRKMADMAEKLLKKKVRYNVIPEWQFKLIKPFSKDVQELNELLPRYRQDNLFISDKFKQHFPDFEITTIEEGISAILLLKIDLII